MTQLSSSDIDELAQHFDKADIVQALILMGSYARNEAGPKSDIDLVRFVKARTTLSDNGTHLHEKKVLINLSTVEPNEYEKWFLEPYEGTQWIAGLRIARALIYLGYDNTITC
jgi:predicted nucleotidyltransferase